jgi:hypothetical protein
MTTVTPTPSDAMRSLNFRLGLPLALKYLRQSARAASVPRQPSAFRALPPAAFSRRTSAVMNLSEMGM